MKPRYLLAGWGSVLIALALLYGWRHGQRERIEPTATSNQAAAAGQAGLTGRRIEPFTLTDEQGEPFSSERLEGRYWIASFFFTSCPGACIRINQAVEELQQTFDTPELQFVSITVHPQYDSPEILREYAQRFHADFERWHFLTGDPDAIRDVARRRFLVSGEPGTHSDRLILVSPQQTVVGYFRGTDPADVERLKARLRKLLEVRS